MARLVLQADHLYNCQKSNIHNKINYFGCQCCLLGCIQVLGPVHMLSGSTAAKNIHLFFTSCKEFLYMLHIGPLNLRYFHRSVCTLAVQQMQKLHIASFSSQYGSQSHTWLNSGPHAAPQAARHLLCVQTQAVRKMKQCISFTSGV